MAITLRQLEYVAAVRDAGSIVGAARSLRVSQPSLSAAIREIERRVDAQLFVREARGVTPTAAGRYLAAAAERILTDAAAVERHIRALGAGQIGEVALAVTPTYSWHYLPAVLEAVAVQAPGLRVSLLDPTPLEILRLVASAEADLGIVVVHDVEALRHGFGAEFELTAMQRIETVVALPTRLAHLPDPVALTELAAEPWVVPNSAPTFPGMSSLIRAAWREAGMHPQVIQDVSTTQTGLPLVAAGIGVTLAPASIMHVTELEVETRRPARALPPLTAVLLHRRSGMLPPAAHRIMDVILETGAEAT